MDRYLFIINPTAGSGRARTCIEFVQEYMLNSGMQYEVLITTRPLEATEMVVENPQYNICVAVGGDGTASEVAKGILKRGYGTLGIIPSGTGNDLALTLNIDKNRENAMERVLNGNVIKIDLGTVKGDYFFNIASLGFDAWVVNQTNKIKKAIKGKTAYVLGVLAALLTYRSKELSIDIDGLTIRRKAILVAVGNGQSYGGGMKILPMAKTDDDMLDICIVKDVSNLKILFLFPSIFKGEHTKYIKYVEFYKGKNISVTFENKYLLNIDGELFSVENEVINFNLSEEKLSVIV